MDWHTLIGPAVVAAVISAFVNVIGFLFTTRAASAMHREKLTFDRDLAERKFEFDKDLAERRFQYDRDLHDHRRQTELAEEVLSGFYQMQDIIMFIRTPISFGGEGETRRRAESETEADTELRNRLFIPIERLNQHGQFIADLRAKGYRMKAMFAEKPFDTLREVLEDIVLASRMMLITTNLDNAARADLYEKWRKTTQYRASDDDPIAQKVESAIELVEQVCRPVFEAKKAPEVVASC